MKLTIKEGLEVLENGMIVTDYAGDVANLLINKPKNYRILYDANIDLWAIAESYNIEHKDMSAYIAKSGFIDPTKKYHGWSVDEIRGCFDYDDDYEDFEVYSDFFFDQRCVVGCIFAPNDTEFGEPYTESFYSWDTKIPTGTIYSREKDDMTEHGVLEDLYKVLERRDLIISQNN